MQEQLNAAAAALRDLPDDADVRVARRIYRSDVPMLEDLVWARAYFEPSHFWHAHVLGWLCSDYHADPSIFFTVDELVTQVLWELLACPWPWGSDFRWARSAISNLGDEPLHELVLRLVERAPDDDGILWMIGDGELAEYEMREGAPAVLERDAKNLARLRRIRRLVVDDLYGGSPQRARIATVGIDTLGRSG